MVRSNLNLFIYSLNSSIGLNQTYKNRFKKFEPDYHGIHVVRQRSYALSSYNALIVETDSYLANYRSFLIWWRLFQHLLLYYLFSYFMFRVFGLNHISRSKLSWDASTILIPVLLRTIWQVLKNLNILQTGKDWLNSIKRMRFPICISRSVQSFPQYDSVYSATLGLNFFIDGYYNKQAVVGWSKQLFIKIGTKT